MRSGTLGSGFSSPWENPFSCLHIDPLLENQKRFLNKLAKVMQHLDDTPVQGTSNDTQ